MKLGKISLACMLLLMVASCKNNKTDFDASGSFEAEETIIAAEANGVIKQFNLEEGDSLKAGQQVGYIDSIQLFLRKQQLYAQWKATGKRIPNIGAQTGYYNQQTAVTQSRLDYLLNEQKRVQNLVKADAATSKQLDDINAQVDETRKQLAVTGKQKEAQVSALQTQSSSISSDLLPLQIQIDQLNDQLSKCRIINPINGTVLTKYAEANEMASQGKPLYKIADLSFIILRAYITSNQLATIKLGQQVTVHTDDGKGGFASTTGAITWISDKSEFTPKTIQTKDERANMVYAIKIKVKNDGTYKIGMYGEVKFSNK
ncbi:MAG: HlyD family efflux transporter periplasmic adaptor subunit [Chitinophagaceae bacterium]